MMTCVVHMPLHMHKLVDVPTYLALFGITCSISIRGFERKGALIPSFLLDHGVLYKTD